MKLLSQSGIGKLTLLVFGSLLAAVIYAGYHIIPFYYYYFELQNQMEQVIRVASLETDESIRKKLLYHMKKYEIPAAPDDLKIVREGDYMRIELKYEEIFFITFRGRDYDIHTFKFRAHAEGHF